MLKIRRSRNRLIFYMGITIPGKDGLYIEMGPWCQHWIELHKLHSYPVRRQWYIYMCSKAVIFFHNAFENVVVLMAAILSRPQWYIKYEHRVSVFLNMFINFYALAQVNDFRIERTKVIFFCWLPDSNPESQTPNRRLNSRWQTDWAIEDQAKSMNSTSRPYDQRPFSPLDPLLVIYMHIVFKVSSHGRHDVINANRNSIVFSLACSVLRQRKHRMAALPTLSVGNTEATKTKYPLSKSPQYGKRWHVLTSLCIRYVWST